PIRRPVGPQMPRARGEVSQNGRPLILRPATEQQWQLTELCRLAIASFSWMARIPELTLFAARPGHPGSTRTKRIRCQTKAAGATRSPLPALSWIATRLVGWLFIYGNRAGSVPSEPCCDLFGIMSYIWRKEDVESTGRATVASRTGLTSLRSL